MNKKRKAELVRRLTEAVDYHLANPTPRATKSYVNDLAIRFGVNRKTLWNAIHTLAQLSEEEILNYES